MGGGGWRWVEVSESDWKIGGGEWRWMEAEAWFIIIH